MDVRVDTVIREQALQAVGVHNPASGRGEDQSGAGACELGGVFEHSYRRFGEGHVVDLVIFDIVLWYCPDAVFEVDLVPGGFSGFAATDSSEGEELEGVNSDGVGVGRRHDSDGLSEEAVVESFTMVGWEVDRGKTVYSFLGGIGFTVAPSPGIFHHPADPLRDFSGCRVYGDPYRLQELHNVGSGNLVGWQMPNVGEHVDAEAVYPGLAAAASLTPFTG